MQLEIQRLQAAEASKLQTLERKGEEYAERLRLSGAETARGLEWTKTGTLLGMSQQRLGAANQARAEAKAQQMSAVGDIGKAGMGAAQMGMKARTPGGTVPVDQSQMRQSYVDPMDAANQNARANQALYQSEGVYDTPQINNPWTPKINLLPEDEEGNPILG